MKYSQKRLILKQLKTQYPEWITCKLFEAVAESIIRGPSGNPLKQTSSD